MYNADDMKCLLVKLGYFSHYFRVSDQSKSSFAVKTQADRAANGKGLYLPNKRQCLL